MNLEYSAGDFTPVLKAVLPPYDGWQSPPAYPQFPPLNRQFQGPDWWKHWNRRVALPKFIGDYETYYAIAKAHRPYLIAALGIGMGYALMSFAQGARAGGVPHATVNGYDDETNRSGSIEWARQAFMTERIPYNLSHSNARQYDECGIPLRHIDLFHVASLRQHPNPVKDLELVWPTLSPRGIVVVDELDDEGVTTDAVVWFAQNNGFAIMDVGRIHILERR